MGSTTCALAGTIGACIAIFWPGRTRRATSPSRDCLREDAAGDADDGFVDGGFSAGAAAVDHAEFVVAARAICATTCIDAYAHGRLAR